MALSKKTIDYLRQEGRRCLNDLHEAAIEELISMSNAEFDAMLREQGIEPPVPSQEGFERIMEIVRRAPGGNNYRQTQSGHQLQKETRSIWEIAKDAASLCKMATTSGVRVLLQKLNPITVQMEPLLDETFKNEWQEANIPLATYIDPAILAEGFGWMDRSYNIEVIYQWNPTSRKLLAKASVKCNKNYRSDSCQNNLLIGLVDGDHQATEKVSPKNPVAYLRLEEVADDQNIEVIILPVESAK